MRKRWVFLLLSLIPAVAMAAPPAPGGFIALVPVVTSGLSDPIGVTHAGDGSNRLFIVERAGRIRIFQNRQLLATPFLDITTLVTCGSGCGERGLLGLAFHPSYEANGAFFVNYTRADGDIVIARYQVSSNPNIANTSGTVLLTIEHSSQANHNGGQLAFGPDGYLYISVGDGGGGGDFLESGQSLNTHLGKILRIDVDGGTPYAIPSDNPFAGAVPGLDEIWDYGLRNPWRFSFDRVTGDLYIGDVGQVLWEEIDFEPAASPGGVNYGWDCREGAHPYDDPNGDMNVNCGPVVSVDPVLEYHHSTGGCSVTGGYVYRGGVQSFLTGSYLYSDFCNGTIRRGFQGGGGAWTSQALSVPVLSGLSSFGEGETGRVYLTYLAAGFGTNVPNSLHWLSPYTFQDVHPSHWAWPYVEAILTSGITNGCDTTPRFCPETAATRSDIAVFLVRAIHGPGFTPPPATGIFADVPTSHPAAAHIEQLYADGLTKGCATNPLRYCPDINVIRAEMAPFLLRARHGGGYTPPPVSGGTSFADVPADYWAAPWIEQLFSEGITTGCALSPRRYCPSSAVTRAEAAGFIARTFNLTLP